MGNKIFNKEIEVHSLTVKAIYYTTKYGEDLHFMDNPDLDYSFEYNILTHTENEKDHIMILNLDIVEPSDDDDDKNEFHIIVEGHFEVSEDVNNELLETSIHFKSLSILLSFLRTAVFNITSMTSSGGFHIPLINVEELHKKYFKAEKKARKKKKKRKKN